MTATAQYEWAHELFGLEKQCAWPGPRPMRSDESLLGRRKDIENFLKSISESKLVLLDGKSGVGKSSLLVAGLIPELRRANYAVAYSPDWQDDTEIPPHKFLADKVVQAFRRSKSDDDQIDATFSIELDDPELKKYPENIYYALDDLQREAKAVIVLDQFEELIRYSGTRGREV